MPVECCCHILPKFVEFNCIKIVIISFFNTTSPSTYIDTPENTIAHPSPPNSFTCSSLVDLYYKFNKYNPAKRDDSGYKLPIPFPSRCISLVLHTSHWTIGNRKCVNNNSRAIPGSLMDRIFTIFLRTHAQTYNQVTFVSFFNILYGNQLKKINLRPLNKNHFYLDNSACQNILIFFSISTFWTPLFQGKMFLSKSSEPRAYNRKLRYPPPEKKT